MRSCGRIALLGLAAGVMAVLAASAADESVPLLKPVVPTGTQVRVRVALEGLPKKLTQFKAQLPRGKKKAELIDVAVAFDSQPSRSLVSTKMLESWGYDIPQNKEFLLPELLIPAAQIAPVPKKDKGGRDVIVRLTNIKLHVVEMPEEAKDKVFSCDLSLSAAEWCKGAERTMEPRYSLADNFLEFTVASAAIKRLNTDDTPLPEVTTDPTETLVPVAGPTITRNGFPVFAYAAVNGQDSYKLPNGTTVPINVGVVSLNGWKTGVVVTIGLARGCKVEMDQAGDVGTGLSADKKLEVIPGKIKELRLGLYTSTGAKTPKDLVLKDVPVVVDKNASDGYVWLGPMFIQTHFKDSVYGAGTDGIWKLHGRCDPELLFDIKTRKKP